MKKYLPLLLLTFTLSFNSRAQYITIPDTGFAQWLANSGLYPGCITGNQLDTACVDSAWYTFLYINSPAIHDITGIKYFSNITTLDCSGCSLTFLPTLPSTITNLNCSNNQLTSLGTLPAGLTTLTCTNNQLQSLPALPWTLTNLYCDQNPLNSLPALPAYLQYLECSFDWLTSLPALPASLTFLDCASTLLDSLPALPAGLTSLGCVQCSNLTSLPALPPGLTSLICGYCSISVLPALTTPQLSQLDCRSNGLTVLPALPVSLKSLSCGFNQITVLPTLGDSITYLDCQWNLLTSMPALPRQLNYLECDFNQLASLPSLPAGLQYLRCTKNQLTGLPSLPPFLLQLFCQDNLLDTLPALNKSLQVLNCTGNKLTALPALDSSLTTLYCDSNRLTTIPTIPHSLLTLSCAYNGRLTYIPQLPDTMSWFLCNNDSILTCLPQLNTIDTINFTNTAVVCLPDYGTVRRSAPLLSQVPLCTVFSPCPPIYNIAGRVIYDSAGSCNFVNGDAGQNYLKLRLLKAGVLQQQVYTGFEGFYSFRTPLIDTYAIQLDTTQLPFSISCPGSFSYTDTIANINSTYNGNNFSLTCHPGGTDLGVNSILNNNVVPRPTAGITVNSVIGDITELYGAHCAAGESGTVRIIYTGQATYAGPATGALTPTSVSGDTLVWNVPDFGAINNNTAFNINLNIDTFATPGSSVCLTASVTGNVHDYNTANNTASYCFNIVNSRDPNEKEVFPTHVDSAGQWLTYTIRFQNTGTAAAVNIRVTDTLSSYLDPSTFQLLAYSAKNVTQLFGNAVVFNFPDINLPDSTTSQSGSTGYVHFKISLVHGLVPGNIISNTASIYFDYNTPVVTNTVNDTIVAAPVCRITYDTISQTICAGDSFNIGGTAFTAGGWHNDTLANIGGCDSIVTLFLHVDSLIASMINVNGDTFCSGGSAVTLSCQPTGGLFMGSGVTGNQFNPLTANIGADTIVYTYTDGNQCSAVSKGYVDVVYFPDSVSIEVILDTQGGVNIFYTRPQLQGNYTWQQLNRDGSVTNLATGDTFAVYCYGFAAKQPFTTDTILMGATVRAVVEMYGCVDTTVWAITQVCQTIGGGINQIGLNSLITLYPNPATDQLFIKTEGINPQSITIYDVDGRLITTQPFTPQINISRLSSGVYFIEVASNEGVARKRFVKM